MNYKYEIEVNGETRKMILEVDKLNQIPCFRAIVKIYSGFSYVNAEVVFEPIDIDKNNIDLIILKIKSIRCIDELFNENIFNEYFKNFGNNTNIKIPVKPLLELAASTESQELDYKTGLNMQIYLILQSSKKINKYIDNKIKSGNLTFLYITNPGEEDIILKNSFAAIYSDKSFLGIAAHIGISSEDRTDKIKFSYSTVKEIESYKNICIELHIYDNVFKIDNKYINSIKVDNENINNFFISLIKDLDLYNMKINDDSKNKYDIVKNISYSYDEISEENFNILKKTYKEDIKLVSNLSAFEKELASLF